MSPKRCPEHFELARKHTPLQKMPRLSREPGVETFFKRDDHTGAELSGYRQSPGGQPPVIDICSWQPTNLACSRNHA